MAKDPKLNDEAHEPLVDSEEALYDESTQVGAQSTTQPLDAVDGSLTDKDMSHDIAHGGDEKAAQTSDYLEDDEDFLRAADELIYDDAETVIARSDDALITWTVENFYDENGKIRGKYALRMKPPVLRITSNSGDEAQFAITKDTSHALAKILRDVNNGYYGIRPLEERSFKEKLVHYWEKIKTNKIKSIVIGSIFLLAILAIIIT